MIGGHSWGGALAELFASRYPRTTACAVLLRRLPLAVVSHGRPAPPADAAARNRSLASHSSDSLLAQATRSTHAIPIAAPAVAIAAIRAVVEAARARTRLPACEVAFADLPASCLPR